MRFIDFEGKTPVNTPADPDVPAWQPWTAAQWQTWLTESAELQQQLEEFHNAGDIQGRNDLIDAHSAHWGTLKLWLQVLSKGKCWFSEVRELYSHYDVEHFRPKKEAKNQDKTVRDGYWWLAFSYTNYRLCGNVGNRKKGGWFPLKDGSLESSFENQVEESEDAFLLDPTNAYDVSLIAFDEEGKAVPTPQATEWERQRVEETIKRLKLNEHELLAEARRKVWQQVSREIDLFSQAKARCGNGGNPAATARLQEHCRNIRNWTRMDAELSSVAKWCIYFRQDSQLSRLVA